MTYHRKKSNMMGALCGAGTATHPEHLSLSSVFSEVSVSQSLVFCVMFCRSFVLLPFFLLAIALFVLQFTASD
jgi:hypothetical protein